MHQRTTLGLCAVTALLTATACMAAPAAGLQAVHRAGQTFLVFPEIEKLVMNDPITWGELKGVLDQLDAKRVVRYEVYRSAAPVTAATLPTAERIATVKPLSVFNVRGRSVDECIAAVRRRAIDDLDLAKKLAGEDYFGGYNPNSPEMDEVTVERFAVEDGKPLPLGVGLYVHNPRQAGKACYAVVPTIDGKPDTGAMVAAGPVDETVGDGEPVMQSQANVTVFYDYPGKRYRYVQWAAPPLTNIPGEYYNWGVFVPAGYATAPIKRLQIFFHDGNQRYLKPPWPHRQDTVLLAPHDAPFASFGYGYNDALGTDKPLEKGTVRPYFLCRVDVVRRWAVKNFGADASRVSVGGRGYWGGTAALQYGLHRAGQIAYVLADGSPDADPGQTPAEFRYYGREDERPRPTGVQKIEASWGKREWDLKAEDGESIWKATNLVALAKAAKVPLPFLSLGAGSLASTWKQETELMLAYKQSRNAFMAEFFWGGSGHLDVPREDFEPRTDRPLLAAWPLAYSPTPGFYDQHFFNGVRGYSSGGRLNTRVRWDSETVLDTAERLEMTIWSDRSIVYAGAVACETTVRNAQAFKPAAGAKLTWTLTGESGNRKLGGGEVTVNDDGLIVIGDLTFGERARLAIERAK